MLLDVGDSGGFSDEQIEQDVQGIFERLRLERSKRTEKFVQQGKWVRIYRCDICSTTIRWDGMCKPCEDKQRQAKSFCVKCWTPIAGERKCQCRRRICEDWLRNIVR